MASQRAQRADLRVLGLWQANLRTNRAVEWRGFPHLRTVKTTSGATAVQIVHFPRRGSQGNEHIGSAHGDAELEALKAAALHRLAPGQGEIDLGLGARRGCRASRQADQACGGSLVADRRPP
jgi:hypothetical protein